MFKLSPLAALVTLRDLAGKPRASGSGAAQRRRSELSQAWRFHTPRPVTWPARGPRLAATYRAARRNAHRAAR